MGRDGNSAGALTATDSLARDDGKPARPRSRVRCSTCAEASGSLRAAIRTGRTGPGCGMRVGHRRVGPAGGASRRSGRGDRRRRPPPTSRAGGPTRRCDGDLSVCYPRAPALVAVRAILRRTAATGQRARGGLPGLSRAMAPRSCRKHPATTYLVTYLPCTSGRHLQEVWPALAVGTRASRPGARVCRRAGDRRRRDGPRLRRPGHPAGPSGGRQSAQA